METTAKGWEKWVALLPALAFVATFGVFIVDKSRSARSVFGSPRGLLTVGIIVVGYVAVSIGLKRLARRAWIPPVVLALVVLALAAWTVRPYYVDTTSDRMLVSGPVETLPPSTTTSPTTEVAPSSTAATAPSTTEPPAAVLLSRGEIVGIDHDAHGTISLIRAADGTLVVRFEAFEIEGVPDPKVYLVEGEDVRDAGGIDLGRPPGNRGDVLDIAVPEAVDAGPGWTVLVWCRAFAVPVANATQLAP